MSNDRDDQTAAVISSETPNRKRSLQFVQITGDHRAESGGAYLTVLNFAIAIRSNGWGTRILSFDHVVELPAEEVTRYAVSRWPLLRHCFFSPAAYSDETRRLINKADCIIVHGTYSLSSLAIIRHVRRAGVPVVVVPHGGLDPWVFSYRAWRKRVWLRLFRTEFLSGSACVIFATEREKEKAKPFVNKSKTAVVNWPIALPAKYEKSSSAEHLRARFDLPAGAKVLLYCGRVHPSKRPLETARAFLAANTPNWVLLIVGPLSREISEGSLAAICEGSNKKCFIAGPQFGADLADCYRGSSAFVLLSHKENFGYTVAEAASYGIPVLISSGIDLSSEVLRHRAGVVCKDETPEGFSRALYDFCNLPDDALSEMGKSGRRWVDEHLSPSSFSAALGEVLAEAVSRRL